VVWCLSFFERVTPGTGAAKPSSRRWPASWSGPTPAPPPACARAWPRRWPCSAWACHRCAWRTCAPLSRAVRVGQQRATGRL